MLKLIKMTIVLGLIVGVLLLAARIHQKSTELEVDLATEKDLVKKNILDIKKEVAKKAIELGKVYENVRGQLDKAAETKFPGLEPKKPETAKLPNVPRPEIKKDVSTQVPIHPVDEEDKKLTEEILAINSEDSPQPEEAFGIPDMQSDAIHTQALGEEGESASPIDLDRVAEIRDLYLKAVQTLDFK